MAAQNYVQEDQAKKWIDAFEKNFPEFTKWRNLNAKLGEARGWMKDSAGRVRFCAEANSKGKDNSADRLAVNHRIQLSPPNK